MRVIDERGRLFGRINVIDFLVLIFFISLFPIFHLIQDIHSRRRAVLSQEEPKVAEVFLEVEMDCKLVRVRPKEVELVNLGDREYDKSNHLIGEIVWLGVNKPYQYILDIGTNEFITKNDPSLQEFSARLKVSAVVRNGRLYYKDQQIKLNAPIIFKTKKYRLEVVPLAIL